MVNISVRGTAIYGSTEYPITSGTVGRKVRFTFDETWDSLMKIGVFECNGVRKEIQLDDINECEFPWEVIVHANVGSSIRVGICGMYEDAIIYPTIYTGIGNLVQGTEITGETGKEYTPTAAEQALAAAKKASEIASSIREDADNGSFDGKSAYQSAVEGGYEGTEEEFNRDLANAATGGSGEGVSGATFIPSVSEDGDLSWTNDKGLDNPPTVNIKGEPGAIGPQGAAGTGIASIEKTSTSGVVDTYTITYDDGTTTAFTVTNGKQGEQGIQGIQGEPGENGHSPIITIQSGNWYIDGVDTGKSAQGVNGETGNGISSIAKTSTDGLVDTYTITFTNGTTTTFTVTNGADGESISGEKLDQLKYAYDNAHEHINNGSSNIITLNRLQTDRVDGIVTLTFMGFPIAFKDDVPARYDNNSEIDAAIADPDSVDNAFKCWDVYGLKYFYDTYVKLTDEKKMQIARACANLIDMSLEDVVGDGVIE